MVVLPRFLLQRIVKIASTNLLLEGGKLGLPALVASLDGVYSNVATF